MGLGCSATRAAPRREPRSSRPPAGVRRYRDARARRAFGESAQATRHAAPVSTAHVRVPRASPPARSRASRRCREERGALPGCMGVSPARRRPARQGDSMNRFGVLTRYSVCFTRCWGLGCAGGRYVGFGVRGRGLAGCFGVDTGSSRGAGASLSAALGIGSDAGGDVVGGERPSRGVSLGSSLAG